MTAPAKPVIGQHASPEYLEFLKDNLRRMQPEETPTSLARRLNANQTTVLKLYREMQAEAKPLVFPSFVADGDDEEPIEQIIDRQMRNFERQAKAASARKWFNIKVPETKPYGILWFGDPHLDNGGCNLPLLKSHIEIAKRDGIYGANIGDTTDNWPWTGRLARLWAESEVSDKTAKRMAEWFMFDAGIRWLVWLLGNHDEWNGGADFYKRLGAAHVPMIDWSAQFTVEHPNGSQTPIDAAHGRKGSSIYNPSHGTLRAARFGEDAALYVTGHIHSFKIDHFEDADRQRMSWLVQVRGYKWFDHHAKRNGFAEFQHGAAVLSIIDPESGAVIGCYADPEEGADVLAYKRSK